MGDALVTDDGDVEPRHDDLDTAGRDDFPSEVAESARLMDGSGLDGRLDVAVSDIRPLLVFYTRTRRHTVHAHVALPSRGFQIPVAPSRSRLSSMRRPSCLSSDSRFRSLRRGLGAFSLYA